MPYYRNFTGVIIEESLKDKTVLQKIQILKTEVEKVTEEHKTPHLNQWTLRTVEIPENQADDVAKDLASSLQNAWYADFKNKSFHYIIFCNKIFKVDRSKPGQYNSVTKYGLSLGIPDYQLDFSPHIKEWKR